MLEGILKALGLLAEPEVKNVETMEEVEEVGRGQPDTIDSTWLRHWHDEAFLSINRLGRSCVDAVTPSDRSGEMDAPLAAMWAVALVFAAVMFVALLRRCRSLLRRTRPKRRRTMAEEDLPAPSSTSVPAATSEKGAAEQQNGGSTATPLMNPPLVRDEGLWPAEGPVQLGQLPRQCDCFLDANYFVEKVCGGKEINVHFEYNGERTTFLEKYGRMYPGNVAEAIFNELEQQRSLRLTAESRTLERKQAIAEVYEPQYPAVRQLLPSYLDPDFLHLVALAQKARTSEEALHQLRQAVQPLSPSTPSVFEMPVLDANFCAQLVSELAHIREEMDDTLLERPNSMNHFGVLLDEFGFTPGFTNVLVSEYIRPLAAALLGPEYASLDNHRAFSVYYAKEGQNKLGLHYDDAAVTLNINLGQQFTGGAIHFYGLRDPELPPARSALGEFRQQIGRGVLHLGQAWHAAEPVTHGIRENLVVWCRSTALFKSRGCSMCGKCRQAAGGPA